MQEFSSVTASSYDAESLAPMLTEKASEGWSVVSIVSAGTNVVAYLTRGGESASAVPAAEAPASLADEATALLADEPISSGDDGDTMSELGTETDESTAIAASATAISPTLPGESVGSVDEPEPESFTDAAASDDASAAVAASGEPAGWGAAPADSGDDTASGDTGSTDAGTTDTSVADLAAQIGNDDSSVTDTSETADTSATPSFDDEPAAEPAEEPAAEPAEASAAAESTVPAGWYADPSGRFELRYWDGQAWTEHVSRAGQQYTDPPVA